MRMDAARRHHLRFLGSIALGAGVAVLLVWFVWFSPGAESRRALGDARDLWESREPSSYAYDYFYCGGMCASCPVHVTVTDGVVVDAVRSGEGCTTDVRDAPTIEDVFDIAADHRPGLLDRSSTVSYDPRWGFPTAISFTCPPRTMDCGGGWSVQGFEVLAE